MVRGTPVDWLWVSSDGSGTMSFSQNGLSYWVGIGEKGGREALGERLARQAVAVVLAGTR